MNTEEKLNILGAKLVEVYEAIRDTDAKDDKLPCLFHLACEMEWRMEIMEHPENRDPIAVPAPVTPKQDLDPAPEAKPPVKLDPIEEPKPIEIPKEPTLTKADMIAKLTPYQSNGVDIGGVMNDMGYAKLSDVPAARYWELLENVQKAADGEG